MGISISTKIGKACYIPISHTSGKCIDKKKVINKLRPILEDQSIKKIGQNIKFDYRNNNLSEDLSFLSASFKGKKSDQFKINNEVKRLKKEKEKNQPTQIKTTGSTFKNQIMQKKKKEKKLIKD